MSVIFPVLKLLPFIFSTFIRMVAISSNLGSIVKFYYLVNLLPSFLTFFKKEVARSNICYQNMKWVRILQKQVVGSN